MKPFGPKLAAAAALVLVAVLPVSLAGCAGGDGSTAAPPSTPPASPVATSVTSASAAPTATRAPTPDVQALLDEARATYGAPGALVSPDGVDGVVIAMNLQADSPANNPNLQAPADQVLCPGT